MQDTKGYYYRISQSSGSVLGTPYQNRFYALHTRNDHDGSLDIMISILKYYHLDVYDLFDLSDTLPFVTPYVSMRFDFCLDILLEPFSISMAVGDYILAKRDYINYSIFFSRSVTHVYLLELDRLEQDVILGWIGFCL